MKIDRLLAIVMLLLTREKTTAAELAAYFEVSVRTIYRDLESLSMTGIPIYTEPGKGGGIFLMRDYRLERQFFCSSELQDIVAAVQGLSDITGDTGLGEAVEKMKFLSGETGEAEPVVFCDFKASMGESEKKVMSLITKAVRASNTVMFKYTARESGRMDRHVEPLRLVYLHKHWYLQAWCRERQDYRLFKISRIEDVRLTSAVFDRTERLKELPPADSRSDRPRRELKLLFSGPGAEAAREFFKDGSISKEKDGILVHAKWSLDEWVYGFLMGFGADLTVIEPSDVRNEVIKRHKKAFEKYMSV